MFMDSTGDATRRGRRVRWRGAAITLTLLLLALVILWIEPDVLSGMHSLITMIVLGAASIALAVWFFRFSRLGRRARWTGALVFGLLTLGAVSAVRIDGWDGSMRPLFAWRWKPTAEERFRQQGPKIAASSARPESAVVERNMETIAASAHDYPAFLGTDRLGVVKDIKLSPDWQAHPPRELWRNVIGLGWSACAVAGDSVVTQEQRDNLEAVVCYELQTGLQRWAHTDEARFSETLGGDGPRATPTLHHGRVYSQGATGILNCLDLATGRRLWSRNILSDAEIENRDWGMAGSPLIVGSVVIATPGGDDGRSVWAYDQTSGEPVWHAGNDPASYASALLTTLAGQEQVLVLTATALAAHDPGNGQQLWRHPWQPNLVIKCTQPAVLADFDATSPHDQVLLSMGYGGGSQLVQVTNQAHKWSSEERWSTRQLRAKFSNMIVRGGYVYGLDEGILTCLNLRDGSRQWKEGRYGYGQMILVDNLLLIQAEKGDVVLVEATPRGARELARLSALSDKTWNPPALAGKYLLVRNDREAVGYELATH